jgi:hypothetical protein
MARSRNAGRIMSFAASCAPSTTSSGWPRGGVCPKRCRWPLEQANGRSWRAVVRLNGEIHAEFHHRKALRRVFPCVYLNVLPRLEDNMPPIPSDQVSPHDKRTGRRSDRAASTPIGAVNPAARATAPPHANATHCSILIAAEKLCCVRSHVYNLLRAGKITAVKAGRRTLVSIASIDVYGGPDARDHPAAEAAQAVAAEPRSARDRCNCRCSRRQVNGTHAAGHGERAGARPARAAAEGRVKLWLKIETPPRLAPESPRPLVFRVGGYPRQGQPQNAPARPQHRTPAPPPGSGAADERKTAASRQPRPCAGSGRRARCGDRPGRRPGHSGPRIPPGS